MADEEKTGQGAGAAKGAKKGLFGGLSTAILIAAAVVIASALSAFLAVTFLGKPAVGKAEKKEEKPAEALFGPTQELGSFTVNLANSPGNFVKAGVVVELSGPEAAADLTTRLPQAKDVVISILSQQSLEEIGTPQGKATVKKSIVETINKAIGKGKVKDVFFTEFVFQ